MECYRSIGITLGLGTSSVRLYTQQFCDIICESRKEFIKLPSTYELPSIMEKFSEKTKIPNVVGTIDGSHIPIKAPEVYKEDYFNRKHRYSVLLQGVVGLDLQFFDVFVGVPGSVHDARLLRLSKLCIHPCIQAFPLSKGKALPPHQLINSPNNFGCAKIFIVLLCAQKCEAQKRRVTSQISTGMRNLTPGTNTFIDHSIVT